jgi:hypothetical protein
LADEKSGPADVPVLRFSGFSHLDGVVQGFSTRRGPAARPDEFNMSLRTAGGADDVLENRRAFCRALGITLERVVFMQQAHGDHVAVVGMADAGRGARSLEAAIPATDAMITRERGIFLAALGADCAVISLYDPEAGAVGIVHAGWRGTVAGIIVKAVSRMREEFGCDPADVIAGIGPAIGPCCYEVGREVLEAAAKGRGSEAVLQRDGRSYFDLRQANVAQLMAAGLRHERIEVADVCTSCERERFFSYRRDGSAGGRFCGIIGMKK